MARCCICRLPKAEHGPRRHRLVYADPYGWHGFTDDPTNLTGAPPPNRPRRAAAVARTFPSIHMTVHLVDPDVLALYFGADVARQVNQVRTSPLLPRRVPGTSLTTAAATTGTQPRPWWRRLLGGNR